MKVVTEENVVIVRYSELHLKGKNRGFFEKLLLSDIKRKLNGIACKITVQRGRMLVHQFEGGDLAAIVRMLGKVFGIFSFSTGVRIATDTDAIIKRATAFMDGKIGTFRAEVNRADKSFAYNSVQFAALIGEKILQSNAALSVNLSNPQHTVGVDIRDEGYTLIFCDKYAGLGGMPCNSSGKGLLLLSGGIDSPVAGFVMARRGLQIDALHFNSYPYTGLEAKNKVVELAKKLSEYCTLGKIYNVKITSIQEAIHKYCDDNYMVTLTRLVMMQIAQKIAELAGAQSLITGESLGQVASQTLEGLVVSDSGAQMPIFRPLISFDKQEIVERARQIGTYDISVLPSEDCCSVFLPDNPATKPDKEHAYKQLGKIPQLNELLNEAVEQVEIIRF